MAIRIPRPAPAPEVAPAAPPPVAPPSGITADEVSALLARRDAQWERRLEAMKTELLATIAANKSPRQRGATIKFTKDHQGVIESAQIIPKE